MCSPRTIVLGRIWASHQHRHKIGRAQISTKTPGKRLWINVKTKTAQQQQQKKTPPRTKWKNSNNTNANQLNENKSQQANNEYVSRDMNNELYRRQKGNIRIPEDKRYLGRRTKKERKNEWNERWNTYIEHTQRPFDRRERKRKSKNNNNTQTNW